MMKCNHCGTTLPDDSNFCSSCGQTPQKTAVFCPACQAELTPEHRFCTKCGAQLAPSAATAVSFKAPLPAASNTVPAAANLPPAGVFLRCLDGLIDVIVLFFLGFVIALFTSQTTSDGFELHGLPAFLWWLSGFIYYVAFESKLGATPGKLLLGLRVVKTDGTACDTKAAVIRTFCRIIDHLLIIGILIILFSKRNQRLGDHLANTVVLKVSAVKLRQVNHNQFHSFDE